jgi:tetratricopeptide (TPR) repeat protein/transcriptional regulator with XRE-family HTH domain
MCSGIGHPGGGVFGQVVVAHRQRLGLTQEELADKTGLSARTIRDLESGRGRVPRQASVRLLADAFGLRGPQRERFQHQASGSSEAFAPQVGDDGQGRVPAQLPADVPGFIGRGAELAQLDTLLTGPPDGSGSAVVISAVSGTAGVGKTALAVRWAHRSRDRFPDGQLYVNLRGYDPDQPMAAADALVRFLGALGVASQEIPVEVDERAARYRTETAGRRLLIVLDNAAAVEQVRPLLPGTASCVVVVTSRDSLPGLVARDGARRLDLDLLPAADAHALLRRLIGPRVEAESNAAADLADRCARLPLALRVAAELAASRPSTPLAELVVELADQQRRLDLLDAGGDPRTAVAAVFSWSIQHLPPDVARVFRLLGLHPGSDADGHAAAALADTSLDRARRALDLLARVHLVHPTGAGRYGMHDLLRAYATHLATGKDVADDPRAALNRLFDYYLATASAAMDQLYPTEAHRRPRIPPGAAPTPALADPDTARAWLDTERSTLVAVSAHTATHGWPSHTVRLSTTLARYLVGGHHTDLLAIHAHARDAARQTGDRNGEALAMLGFGIAHGQMGRHKTAAEHLERARVLFRQAGDRVGQARALTNLGSVEVRLGRHALAAEHHERALTLFRQAGDQAGAAWALNALGTVERRLGRHELAAEHHEQALALFRRAGDRTGEARVLTSLGLVEERMGRHGLAAHHHQQALALFRRAGNRTGEASALDNLGTVHTHLGRPDQAAEDHRQALALFRESGDREGEAWALNGLGEAAHATGHPAAALAHHAAALTIATATGARAQQARAQTGLGRAHHTLVDPTRAREHYGYAIDLYTDLGMPDADDVRAHLTTLDG